MTDAPHASPEALEALEAARQARADNEAVLPAVAQLSRRVHAQVEANHFLDLIDGILHEVAANR